jgi:phosphatidylglycerol:prolipoprotein diacylglycerol transferase
MHPVMFRWRGLTIHSYPAMQYVGLVAGVTAGNAAAHVAGLNTYRVFIATCILLFPALAGARLLYVASHWRFYRRNRSSIWNRSEGGAAQYGGFLVAVPLSAPLLGALQVPFAAFWDVSMVTIMVGMIFTRIGCFLNGCCAGRPTESWFAISLPDHTGVWERRIPTQLLEAGWSLILLAAALAVWPTLPFDGALFLVVSAGYATGRLLLESTRNSSRNALTFTLHHAISLLIIAVSVAALTLRGQP